MSRISEYYSMLKSTPMRLNHEFSVSLSGSGVGGLDHDITFMAKGATLPGKEITTAELKFQGLGFKVPGNVQYAHEFELTCICDSNMNTYEDVKAWMAKFSNLAMSTGGKKLIPDTKFYIDLLDPTLSETVRSYQLIGVFPHNIGGLELSHEGDGSAIMDFSLGLTYQYFIENGQDPIQQGDGVSILETVSEAIDKAGKVISKFK